MSHEHNWNRREFLERMGAGALLGTAALSRNRAHAASTPAAWTPPPTMKNPNILIIMVDQLRPPMWMTNCGSMSQLLPHISSLENNAYNFGQYFVAATVCVPSRSALLTGLYAPQTAMYCTTDLGANASPPLNPAFPTWGRAVPLLNPAYAGNMWWFGKWHVSDELNSAPLEQYGFNTRTYPGGPTAPYNPSPDGMCNEGTDGGVFNGNTWANDSMIGNDFLAWLQGQPSVNGEIASPWCATVSFVNPHDICFAPGWLQTPVPPPNLPPLPVYFQPPSGSPPGFYTDQPFPWNYENLAATPNKPSLQLAYVDYENRKVGPVTYWPTFLNQYYWLQSFVDTQIGYVLQALSTSPYASNTIIVFTSDHGEYAGSHGMHTKDSRSTTNPARPILCSVSRPDRPVNMNQMCSWVDFFGFICDLASGGSGQWMLAYPDFANRQSVWSFLYNNCAETRVAPAPVGIPYVLHTCDEGATSFSEGAHRACGRNWT